VGTQSYRSKGQAYDSGVAGPDDVAALVPTTQQRTGSSSDSDPATGRPAPEDRPALPGVTVGFVHRTWGFCFQMPHSARALTILFAESLLYSATGA